MEIVLAIRNPPKLPWARGEGVHYGRKMCTMCGHLVDKEGIMDNQH